MNDNENAALVDMFLRMWSRSSVIVSDKLSENTIAIYFPTSVCSLLEFSRFKALCGERLYITDWRQYRIEAVLTAKDIADRIIIMSK